MSSEEGLERVRNFVPRSIQDMDTWNTIRQHAEVSKEEFYKAIDHVGSRSGGAIPVSQPVLRDKKGNSLLWAKWNLRDRPTTILGYTVSDGNSNNLYYLRSGYVPTEVAQ